jgi:HD-like signal output (HDOD) protein
MKLMNKLSDSSSPLALVDTTPLGEEQQRRRSRLKDIIDHGLPPFPNAILELTAILSGPSVDVKKASKVIRTDPSLSAQVLRLCNSPMYGLRSRVISIEQATVLLGTERLRSLAMTCSLVNYSGGGLPRNQAMNFWQHSFLAALLSEFLAKRNEYFEKEQAYIAGLLHDIGQLPQWMLASEEKSQRIMTLPESWNDDILVERNHFGMDHSEIGSCMAVSWNFMPSFIDVLGNHHDPQAAKHDPNLVGIIGTVEYYLLTKVKAEPALVAATPEQADQQASAISVAEIAESNRQAFIETHSQSVLEALDQEYERLLPLVQSGLKFTIGSAT